MLHLAIAQYSSPSLLHFVFKPWPYSNIFLWCIWRPGFSLCYGKSSHTNQKSLCFWFLHTFYTHTIQLYFPVNKIRFATKWKSVVCKTLTDAVVKKLHFREKFYLLKVYLCLLFLYLKKEEKNPEISRSNLRHNQFGKKLNKRVASE